MLIVDAHAHIIVPEITREAQPGEHWRPRVYWDERGQVIECAGREIRSAVREFVHAPAILAEMEMAGVDRAILCPYVPLLRYEADPRDALESSRIQNQALARLARAHPRRISVLGTVPLQDPDLAARELDTLMQGGVVAGVEIATSVRGVYLGDDRFRPFWKVAEDTGAVVFVHPTTGGFDIPALNDYYLSNTVGNPLETTITAAHLLMAGVLEAHPRLRILLAHGGGTILGLRGRLRHAHAVLPQARARLRESPEASLRRFYFDTVTHDPGVLRTLIDFAGADHVLTGSDYPFDMGVTRPADVARALELRPEDEGLVLGGNAVRLLGGRE